MRDGGLIGLRGKPLGLGTGRAVPDGVRSPLRLNLDGVGACLCGDSGRGKEGRLTCGRRVAGLGPTDLLKLTAGRAGVGGAPPATLAEKARLVTYLLLFIGTKIPDPGFDVEKYFLPSTSPLFFPRLACSDASSIPANLPGLPATVPKYLTVPYIPPGTFTVSPIWTSSRGAIGIAFAEALLSDDKRGRFRVQGFRRGGGDIIAANGAELSSGLESDFV